ncbi:MAG: hypothetical protein QXS03_01480 [Candidatus Micrarchaeaceae archaeon]
MKCLTCGSELVQLDAERSLCPFCTFPYQLEAKQIAELKAKLGVRLWSLILKNRTLLLCNGYRIDIQRSGCEDKFVVRKCDVYGDGNGRRK